jgi:hypothetical protein
MPAAASGVATEAAIAAGRMIGGVAHGRKECCWDQ